MALTHGLRPSRWRDEAGRGAVGPGDAVNARLNRASHCCSCFRRNRSISRSMAMEKTTAGAPGDGVGGNRTERADRVIRPRFRATAAANGARARGTAIHGGGCGPPRTERHKRQRGERRRKSATRREREAAAGLTGAHGAVKEQLLAPTARSWWLRWAESGRAHKQRCGASCARLGMQRRVLRLTRRCWMQRSTGLGCGDDDEGGPGQRSRRLGDPWRGSYPWRRCEDNR